jgi:hypothetical protein
VGVLGGCKEALFQQCFVFSGGACFGVVLVARLQLCPRVEGLG